MPEIKTLPNGIEVELRGDDLQYHHIQRFWRMGLFYEQDMLNHIAQKYQGGVFIDIGASVGNHSIFFAKYCQPVVVFSFEPQEESYDHMVANIHRNGLSDQVWAFPYALAETLCSGDLTLPKGGNEGMWEFKENTSGTVKAAPLDSFNISDVTLIKIDAEGYVIPILKGSLETIRQSRPVVFIEAQAQKDLEEIESLLGPLGYETGQSFNATPTYEFAFEGNSCVSDTTNDPA